MPSKKRKPAKNNHPPPGIDPVSAVSSFQQLTMCISGDELRQFGVAKLIIRLHPMFETDIEEQKNGPMQPSKSPRSKSKHSSSNDDKPEQVTAMEPSLIESSQADEAAVADGDDGSEAEQRKVESPTKESDTPATSVDGNESDTAPPKARVDISEANQTEEPSQNTEQVEVTPKAVEENPSEKELDSQPDSSKKDTSEKDVSGTDNTASSEVAEKEPKDETAVLLELKGEETEPSDVPESGATKESNPIKTAIAEADSPEKSESEADPEQPDESEAKNSDAKDQSESKTDQAEQKSELNSEAKMDVEVTSPSTDIQQSQASDECGADEESDADSDEADDELPKLEPAARNDSTEEISAKETQQPVLGASETKTGPSESQKPTKIDTIESEGNNTDLTETPDVLICPKEVDEVIEGKSV
jgi:hypothetical protein